MSSTESDCLGPAVAGSWYPAESAELSSLVDDLLAEGATQSDPPPVAGSDSTRPIALIAPHAGFVYSGAVAGAGFVRLPREGYERIILIGPSHYSAFNGAALPASRLYSTPLGEIPLDHEAIARLSTTPGVQIDERPFLPEHSLEAELPFLQRVLEPGWKLLPVLLGRRGPGDTVDPLAEALRVELSERTLLVVSSDFVHYGPRFGYVPFTTEVPTAIERLDKGAIDLILEHDRDGFADYIERTGATICGRDGIDLLLRLLGEKSRGKLAGYDTSGRMTASWDHSVSYASVVFES